MSKETWLIEPRDALIARDGRPFGITAGIRAKSLDFPFPSTTTGGVRTRSGLDLLKGDVSEFPNYKINGESLSDAVQKIEVRGALLAEVEGDEINLLVHAPADCLIVKPENEGEKNRFPLVPLEPNDAEFCSNLDKDLYLLGTTETVKGKPQSEPRFWYWSEFEKWLTKTDIDKPIDVKTLGHHGLTGEQRTHVKILDDTNGYKNKANVEGGLFQTRGLEFTFADEKTVIISEKLALVVEVERRDSDGEIENGIAPLGGERRVVAWRKSDENVFPDCDEEIRKRISDDKACRLILLTPAIFENGFKPTWLQTANGLRVSVEAIAVNRTQVISGWDFKGKIIDGKRKQCPKPTRRMCPAGTVLFLKLSNGDIGKWIDETWFRCVSDKEQDRKDGFGLAALGTWDGTPKKLADIKGLGENL